MPDDRSSRRAPEQARSLGFLLRETYAALQQRVYAAVARAGHPDVRPVHSSVLRNLAPEGGRVSDLARTTGMAKQSITYVVEDLVRLGYLESGPDPDDGRARRLSYTPRGRRLLKSLVDASEAAEVELAAALGPQRLAGLRDTLEAVLSLRAHEEPGGESRNAAARRRATRAR